MTTCLLLLLYYTEYSTWTLGVEAYHHLGYATFVIFTSVGVVKPVEYLPYSRKTCSLNGAKYIESNFGQPFLEKRNLTRSIFLRFFCQLHAVLYLVTLFPPVLWIRA